MAKESNITSSQQILSSLYLKIGSYTESAFGTLKDCIPIYHYKIELESSIQRTAEEKIWSATPNFKTSVFYTNVLGAYVPRLLEVIGKGITIHEDIVLKRITKVDQKTIETSIMSLSNVQISAIKILFVGTELIFAIFMEPTAIKMGMQVVQDGLSDGNVACSLDIMKRNTVITNS